MVGAVLLVTLTLAGCYQDPDPTEWGARAKANFVAGCTTEVDAGDGTTTTIKLASRATCECIYELIKKPESGGVGKYAIEWDALKAYEKQQADADAGELPSPPKQLTQAIGECRVAGPSAG